MKPLPIVETGAGQIGLEARRRYNDEVIRHLVGCAICGTMTRPSSPTAHAACELAGIDPARFAYEAREMSEPERAHYLNIAAQAVTVVLGCRVRHRASNVDYVDALGAAFSRHYTHTIRRGPARSVREMREQHALAVRRELYLVGIDLDGIAADDEATTLYSITRMTTLRKGKRQPGRRIVTLNPEAVGKFTALLADTQLSPTWPPTLAESLDEPLDEQAEIEGRVPRYRVIAETKYEVAESGDRATRVLDRLEQTTMLLDVAAFREDLRKAEETCLRLAEELERRGVLPERAKTPGERGARMLTINARAKERFRSKKERRAWRRETLLLLEEYERAASLVETYGPLEARLPGEGFYPVRSRYERTVNRRFQPMTPLWPAAVTDKMRPPFGTELRRRWFRTQTGPYIEVDVSSSQTQVLAYLLGSAELEGIAGKESFNKFLAREAWRRSRPAYRGEDRFRFWPAVHKDDAYESENDERLLALVKAAWMRTLYGSEPGTIALDQAASVGEYGQGWDRKNLERFLEGVPGWETVSVFLKACQAIGSLERHQYGITLHDPFDDEAEFRWQPVWRVSKPLTTRGTKHGFTFAIDRPHTADGRGLRVEKRKLRDCIAPRWVHCLDAAFNAIVIEKVASVCKPDVFPLVAVHDAWITAQIGAVEIDWKNVPSNLIDAWRAEFEPGWPGGVVSYTPLRWALDEAAEEWFKDLRVVYDDLIRLTAGTEYAAFARGIKRTWKRRLDACKAGTKPWPAFLAKAIEASPV